VILKPPFKYCEVLKVSYLFVIKYFVEVGFVGVIRVLTLT
jgi:hypothetical protein